MAVPIALRHPNSSENLGCFTNHLSEFVKTKEFWDKGLETVFISANVAEWSFERNHNDSGAHACHQVKVISNATRGVIKLLDFFGAFKVPDKNLDQGQLAGTIIKSIGFGVSDCVGTLNILQDFNVISLGKARGVINIVGHSFCSVGHLTSLVMDSLKMDHENGLHNQYFADLAELKEDLQNFENHYSIDLNEVIDSIQVDENETVDDVLLLWNHKRLNVAQKQAQIDEMKFEKTKTALQLAHTVFDIFAFIFHIVLMIVTIPLIIVMPLAAMLGFGSAGTALAKLWLETGVQPIKPEDLALT